MKRRTPRPKSIREWQRKRCLEWRRRYYPMGLTYKKVDGHWGWAKKTGNTKPARIHLNDPREIERIRKKIRRAAKK